VEPGAVHRARKVESLAEQDHDFRRPARARLPTRGPTRAARAFHSSTISEATSSGSASTRYPQSRQRIIRRVPVVGRTSGGLVEPQNRQGSNRSLLIRIRAGLLRKGTCRTRGQWSFRRRSSPGFGEKHRALGPAVSVPTLPPDFCDDEVRIRARSGEVSGRDGDHNFDSCPTRRPACPVASLRSGRCPREGSGSGLCRGPKSAGSRRMPLAKDGTRGVAGAEPAPGEAGA
jgi:hypothetical protein